MTRAPELTRPMRIPALAAKLGVPRRTLLRRLCALHAADRERGDDRALWFYRLARGRPWLVNLSRLHACHPELFDAPDAEGLRERLDAAEESGRFIRRQVNALHAAFREHRQEHAHASP